MDIGSLHELIERPDAARGGKWNLAAPEFILSSLAVHGDDLVREIDIALA
jgi:hypothetical protein